MASFATVVSPPMIVGVIIEELKTNNISINDFSPLCRTRIEDEFDKLCQPYKVI
jgi:hypothetical protein